MGAKGAKITVQLPKRALRGSKIRKSAIFQQIWLYKANKLAYWCKQIGTIALEKVLWGIEFIRIGYWTPKEQKLQLCMPY